MQLPKVNSNPLKFRVLKNCRYTPAIVAFIEFRKPEYFTIQFFAACPKSEFVCALANLLSFLKKFATVKLVWTNIDLIVALYRLTFLL
jgi:hypothetical protein